VDLSWIQIKFLKALGIATSIRVVKPDAVVEREAA
jgi:fatty-acid desaturase